MSEQPKDDKHWEQYRKPNGGKMKNKNKDERSDNIFVGFMFLGMGIGYFMDNFLVGACIGMGLGFLGNAMFTGND